ncbi:YraN family protein [Candidatus Kaiserbacteria bacterium]|nr:YraN family protein [Candidatus Kaiserbacteria bacterium]
MNPGDTLKRDERRKKTGKSGEDIACLFLQRKGYRILERNYREPWGEIDIIGIKGNIVRFVEVKTVSVADFSRESQYSPEELVDTRKLRKFARTAELYMEKKKDTREFQLDVVGILLNRSTRTARCNLIEQALEGNL